MPASCLISLLSGAALLSPSDAPGQNPAAQPRVHNAEVGPSTGHGQDHDEKARLEPGGQNLDFAADSLNYDADQERVTATGNIILRRGGYSLRADQLDWDRRNGTVEASGKVEIISPEGDKFFGDRMRVNETLTDAAVENMLVVLKKGGRIAAKSGSSKEGNITLNKAVYSPCGLFDSHGRPTSPTWRVKAVRVTHDQKSHKISYEKAWLEIKGVPALYLPHLTHPDGSLKKVSGLLTPDIGYDRHLGLDLSFPVYVALSPKQDLTVTPHIYSDANPSLGLEYRRVTEQGPLQIGAIGTVGKRIERNNQVRQGPRGYFNASGQLEHNARLRSTFGARLTLDDTFMRRYSISRDLTLRNFYMLEAFGDEFYGTAQGWAFQSLSAIENYRRQQPAALPLIDIVWRPDLLPAGAGQLHAHFNTLTAFRGDGPDTVRMLASLRHDVARTTPWGHRITLTSLGRFDTYHVTGAQSSISPSYAGRDGFSTRGIGALALDMTWPFAGPAFGGIQTWSPRVQLVAAASNQSVRALPNEDSRAFELDELSLFDINRFSGFDVWEDDTRLNYGVEWHLERRALAASVEVGQTYRFSKNTDAPFLFIAGSGLRNHFSDIVSRSTLQITKSLRVSHRMRFDKNSFDLRRNEVSLRVGTAKSYAEAGYLRLNRDLNSADLDDVINREEIRAGGRVGLNDNWALFGSMIANLGNSENDPIRTPRRFQFIRHRIGILYQENCFDLSFSWRRDFTSDRDFERGSTFLLRLALRTG